MRTFQAGSAKPLYAFGPQDTDLTDDPDVTFWKEDLEAFQYAPFGQETRECTFRNERQDAGNTFFDQKLMCTISPSDVDMLGSLTLQMTLPTLRQVVEQNRTRTSYVKWAYGGVAALVEYVEIASNGVVLQRFDGRALDIESQMRVPPEQKRGYDDMTGRNGQHDGRTARPFYLPLPFWFCDRRRREGVPYLPVCAMRRTTRVDVTVKILPLIRCVNANRMLDASSLVESDVLTEPVHMVLLADTVILDHTERLLFTGYGRSRSYLIEEVQQQEDVVEVGTLDYTLTLEARGCVKRMHWVIQDVSDSFPNTLTGNRHLAYDGYHQLFLEANRNSENAVVYPPPIRTCQILFSGNAREPYAFSETGWNVSRERVDASFYTVVQPLIYHGCNASLKDHIFSYFFALRPFEFQPSGSFDMTIGTNQLHLTFVPGLRRLRVFVYTVGYNVLRITELGETSVDTVV